MIIVGTWPRSRRSGLRRGLRPTAKRVRARGCEVRRPVVAPGLVRPRSRIRRAALRHPAVRSPAASRSPGRFAAWAVEPGVPAGRTGSVRGPRAGGYRSRERSGADRTGAVRHPTKPKPPAGGDDAGGKKASQERPAGPAGALTTARRRPARHAGILLSRMCPVRTRSAGGFFPAGNQVVMCFHNRWNIEQSACRMSDGVATARTAQ